ncbi:glycosyltransferase [Murimonas intestini]|uniref:Glycosyltransferase involved in cell wall biosynthesis n=1 Tax=Murimonas intestini TaxID=1337051 RepID=A0AB73T6W0_9FIRM|nr:glycosyltransferase [Murimonas intestini]MCR1839598.1 glycosyltransferase [Murimonas intestini]MCR1866441.1 glycosyltransferase [Murimonas intestini]MCR1882441.1 glycosyltransferase [Murimonas intestini]
MKKVLFLIESLSGGGAEKVLTDIVRNIDKKKFNVTVMTVVKTGVYVNEVSKHCTMVSMLPPYEESKNLLERIKYHRMYKFIYSATSEKVYRWFIQEKYDVEIAFVEGFTTKLVAASSNKYSKKVAWVHIDMEKNPYADQYFSSIGDEKEIYEKFDRIISVSKSVKDVFQKKFRVNVPNQIIYNPIDTENIILKANEQIFCTKNKKLQIITVGRLEYQKGFDRLINALAEINDKSIDYHLWVLGEGTMRRSLEEMIKKEKLENRVSLLGFQENPYAWMKNSDAFFCTSRAEGYSLVVAEAMILGLPVISVDCSGPNELLDYGNYGMIIPNTDNAISKTIKDLICGKIDLKSFSVLSLKRKTFFSIKRAIKEIENLIEEI